MRKLFYITGISVGLLFSCKKANDEIGLDQPSELLQAAVSNDSEIKSYTFLDNAHTITESPAYALIGAYDDPYVGKLSAYFYTQLYQFTEYDNHGANYICDSVKLYFKYATFSDGENHSYGDTLAIMPIEVYQIEEDFDTDYEYKSSDELEASILVGKTSDSFKPTPNTSDQLEINLSKSFGQQILTASTLASNEQFQANFKGLKIGAATDAYGAVLGMENLSVYSYMVVYYNNSLGQDSSFYYFNSGVENFNQIVSDYSSTQISGLTKNGDTLNTELTGNKLIMQSGTGLGNIIKFPGFEKLADTTETLTVLKVDLILSIDKTTTSSYSDEPPTALIAYEMNGNRIKTDENGDPIQINNDDLINGTSSSALFVYDEDLKLYNIPLTNHFENYVKGEKDNLDICLQSYLSSSRVNRGIYNNQNIAARPLKLVIYYSTLKQ